MLVRSVRGAAFLCLLLLSSSGLAAQDAPAPSRGIGMRELALLTGATAIASLLDAPVARTIRDVRTDGTTRLAHGLKRFGEAGVIAPVIGGLAVAGVVAKRPALTRTAGQTAAALLLTTAVAQTSKRILGRARPYEDADRGGDDFAPFGGRTALPSGHTAAAFAMATVLGDAIGDPVARVALLGLAAGTGVARVIEEKHWFSDVIAGAALGVVSARFATGRVRVFGLTAPAVLMTPHGPALGWQVTR